MLSIPHVGWYHTVLIQPADRPVSTLVRLRNVEAVTWSAPLPLPAASTMRGVYIFYTCVFDSSERMLSITAVG